jgi:hypothetical protein
MAMPSERWEDQRQHRPANKNRDGQSDTEDYPFRLLTLQRTGHTPITVELHDSKERRLANEQEKADLSSVSIQRERRVWEEGGRD